MASGYPSGRDAHGRSRTAVAPCRDCKRPMRWASSPTGKRVPLDPDPSPFGDVVLITQRGWALAVQLRDRDLVDEAQAFRGELEAGAIDVDRVNPVLRELYTVHWDTCPNRTADVRERADLA